MLHYNKPIYGYIYYKNEKYPNTHKVTIFSANALCAMVEITEIPKKERKNPKNKFLHHLFGFFADEQHIKNVMKHEGEALPMMFSKVTSIKLNMYYKEARTLAKYFAKSKYKVTCYYEESGD